MRQRSGSPSSQSRASWSSSSTLQSLRRQRPQPPVAEGDDLFARLAAAERSLCCDNQSSGGSGDSEERDTVHEAEEAEKQWPRKEHSSKERSLRSNHASSSSSSSKGYSQLTAYAVNLLQQCTNRSCELPEVLQSVPSPTQTWLESEMEKMAERHRVELGKLYSQLQQALLSEANSLQQVHSMQEEVADAQQTKIDQRNELQDVIAGFSARHEQQIQNMKDRNLAVQKKQRALEEEKQIAWLTDKHEILEEFQALEATLEQSRAMGRNAAEEGDILRKILKHTEKVHNAQLGSLMRRLEAATSPQKPALGPTAAVAAADLEEELAQSEEKHRETADELSKVRLQMLGMQRSQMEAEAKMGGSTPQHSRIGKTRDRGLPTIRETASDAVSSVSGCGGSASSQPDADLVGDAAGDLWDLDDVGPAPTSSGLSTEQRQEYEDRITALMDKNDLQKEQAADDDARNSARIKRLTELLKTSNEHKDVAREELGLAEQHLARERSEHSSELHELKDKLGAANVELVLREESKATILEEKLSCALQNLERAENRLDEFRYAMRVIEQDHRRALESKAALPAKSPEALATEVVELRRLLHETVEEKNLLTNKLECMEVHHTCRLQELELDKAAEIQAISHERDQELQRAALQHADEVAQLKQRMQVLERDGAAKEQELTALQERQRKLLEEKDGLERRLEVELTELRERLRESEEEKSVLEARLQGQEPAIDAS